MAQTQARGGFGTRIYRYNGTAWESIGEVRDVNGPTLTGIVEDATHMESPNGWEERVHVGVKSAGEVTFALQLVQSDAMQAALRADLSEGTLREWRLVLPSGTRRIAFDAYVTTMGNAFPLKGIMTRDITFTITGEPVEEAHP